ncbi:MAG: hypothetical protein JWO52_2 [Gammaproteobacteria bacterium]|jgi:hypothetical protein|nr:hypothetical protein [Gammaproteobacteria bacterium]
MSVVIRLLFVLATCTVTQAFAQSPASVQPEHPVSQPPAAADAASQPPATAQPSPPETAAKPDTSDKASATQSSNASAATADAPAVSGAMKTVLIDKTLTNAQVKQLLAKGYKPQGRGDEVYYCRREQELGSRFEHKVCKTADQIMRDELDAQEMTGNVQKGMGSPSGH